MKGKPMIARILPPLLLAALPLSAARAQDEDRASPPNARPLSEIVAMVEKRNGFRTIDGIERDEDGFWEVTYHMADRARVEIPCDPVTGDPG